MKKIILDNVYALWLGISLAHWGKIWCGMWEFWIIAVPTILLINVGYKSRWK